MTTRKKLIEVALPLDAINAASAREKSIRHGHPSTLHLWWARRPLAACRAVLFASIVDDPGSRPDRFPTVEAQDAERQRLFRLIEELVKWENSNDERVLGMARAEIMASTDGHPPPVLDPFAGGGSIPLEAQRLGLEAHASDLNPVAVLINKALIEIPPKFAGQPPVNPEARGKMGAGAGWKGAAGLAEDVRYYGQWMRDEAERRIGHLYPKVRLPKERGGGEATVIAWLWARTVQCPNPACGARMPLVRSFALSTKPGKAAWVEPQVDRSQQPPAIGFAVRTGQGTVPEAPKLGRGANFTCLACGTLATDPYVKSEGMAGRMGTQMMAVVAEGSRERIYLPPSPEQEAVATQAVPAWKPEAQLPDNARWFSPPIFGMTTYGDLFTPRQLVALTTFSDLVAGARTQAARDAAAAGLPADGAGLDAGGRGAQAYGDAVATYLGIGCQSTSQPLLDHLLLGYKWRKQSSSVFARQAIPMAWDFAEANPLCRCRQADLWRQHLPILHGVLWSVTPCRLALASSSNVTLPLRLHCVQRPWSRPTLHITTTSAMRILSDFFYVWLRRSLSCCLSRSFQYTSCTEGAGAYRQSLSISGEQR